MNWKKILFIILALCTLGIISIMVFLMRDKMFIMVDNSPLSLINYQKVYISRYIWNQFLVGPSADQALFNFRTYLYEFGSIFLLNLGQVILLTKILGTIVSTLGTYLLINFFNYKYLKNYLPKEVILLASLAYAFNPSFQIGDGFWLGIQFAFFTLPLLLYCVAKIFSEKKYIYFCLYIFLLSVNNDAHFVFGGYFICFAIIILLVLLLDLKERKEILKIKNLIILFLLGLFYFLALAPDLIGTLNIVSPVQTLETIQSIDVPWSSAIFINLFRAVTYTDLFSDFYTFNSISTTFFINFLLPFIFIIPLSVLIFRNKFRNSINLNKIIYFFLILYLLIIIIFASDSPLNIRDWIILHVPVIGRVLRTWRITDVILALCTSFLTSFSLFFLTKRINKYFIYSFYIVVLFSLVFPIFINRTNDPTITIPKVYLDLNKLKLNSNSKMIEAPEFTSSFGLTANLKPYWSPTIGINEEFLGYSTPIPSVIPLNAEKEFYLYTVSEFYNKVDSLLPNNNFYALSHVLASDNVEYLELHTDLPTNIKNLGIDKNILKSSSWLEIWHEDFLTLLQNKVSSKPLEVFPTNNIILVDGGYRAVSNFLNRISPYYNDNYDFLYIDQNIPYSSIIKSKYILTDKSLDQLKYELSFSLSESKPNTQQEIIFPAQDTDTYNPIYKWSTGTLLGVHQEEWQPYINVMGDYAWDFDWNEGYLFTDNSSDSITVKSNLEPGTYKILVRYLSNDHGGQISLGSGNSHIDINTKGDYDGFLWNTQNITIGSDHRIKIQNINGFNAISVILLQNKSVFQDNLSNVNNLLSSKTVINTQINDSDNLFNIGKLDTQSDINALINYKNIVGFTESLEDLNGVNSVSVSTADITSKKWSWLASNWINVIPGDTYKFITNIKISNAQESHIVLLGHNNLTGNDEEISQLPSAISGTVDWNNYEETIVIPPNYSQVRFVLNAGTALQKNTSGITWFSDIELLPLLPKITSFQYSPNDLNVSYKEINPTLWSVSVKNASNDFLVDLKQSYDPGWRLEIKNHNLNFLQRLFMFNYGSIISEHIESDSLNNGWYVDVHQLCEVQHVSGCTKNADGSYNLEMEIEFWPQRWFYVGLVISGTTLAAVLGYLGYAGVQALRKRKNHRRDSVIEETV
jgi:hypothetical protein